MTRKLTMFEWLKPRRKIVWPVGTHVEAPIKAPEDPPVPQINDNGYTIGYADGLTLFKLKAGMNTVTMTLTPDEVYRMIRLLKASLNQDPEDETSTPTL
jgi:hypothetical protein